MQRPALGWFCLARSEWMGVSVSDQHPVGPGNAACKRRVAGGRWYAVDTFPKGENGGRNRVVGGCAIEVHLPFFAFPGGAVCPRRVQELHERRTHGGRVQQW